VHHVNAQRSSATYPARCSSVIVADMRDLLSSLSSVVALRLTEWLDMEVGVGTLPLTRVHQPPAAVSGTPNLLFHFYDKT